MDDAIWLERFLKQKAPRGERFVIRRPYAVDEAHWFRRGIEEYVFSFCSCGADCPRLRKRKEGGPDEFRATSGKSGIRHLFSLRKLVNLNREYIPHMAAVTRLVLGEGYNQARSSFSLYRTFTRDLHWKKRGQSYESDAEFYDADGHLWLQVEAKKSQGEIVSIVNALDRANTLVGDRVPKELEYVVDLKPRYLWLVAPGLIDPARYVYKITVDGLAANFSRQERVPPAG